MTIEEHKKNVARINKLHTGIKEDTVDYDRARERIEKSTPVIFVNSEMIYYATD